MGEETRGPGPRGFLPCEGIWGGTRFECLFALSVSGCMREQRRMSGDSFTGLVLQLKNGGLFTVMQQTPQVLQLPQQAADAARGNRNF